jgi:hypothetical protein
MPVTSVEDCTLLKFAVLIKINPLKSTAMKKAFKSDLLFTTHPLTIE